MPCLSASLAAQVHRQSMFAEQEAVRAAWIRLVTAVREAIEKRNSGFLRAPSGGRSVIR